MSNDISQSVATLIGGAAGIVVLMGLALAWAQARQRLSIVDTIWGLGFVVIGVVSFVIALGGDGVLAARWLLLVMPVAWGVRLAVHIARRNAGLPEDPRYVDLVQRNAGSLASIGLRKVFLPQGVIMWVVALPIMIGVNNDDLVVVLAILGVVIWAIGLFFESVGDAQLARFKGDPANKGQVMDRGLWRYTRHPNYFGDACVWWGIWLVAASSWLGLATIVAPLIMTYLLAGKTGKPLTEKSMSQSKPGYAEYVRRTSGFVPRPPKKI